MTISDGVTMIGESAFADCSSLTSVVIPNSVTSLGGSAFYSCSALASVTISNKITTIPKSVFQYCKTLTSVTIPDSVFHIEDSAFNQCNSLTFVTIPGSVTVIKNNAFSECRRLASATILNSAADISYSAFLGCPDLTIRGYAGSTAEAYGEKNHLPFEKLAVSNSVTGVMLDKTELLLNEGNSEMLTATVYPVDAANKGVNWQSSDPSVAKVEEGKVTAVKTGTAVITVKTLEGGKTAACKVTVRRSVPLFSDVQKNDWFTPYVYDLAG